jgi:hypothetical protein
MRRLGSIPDYPVVEIINTGHVLRIEVTIDDHLFFSQSDADHIKQALAEMNLWFSSNEDELSTMVSAVVYAAILIAYRSGGIMVMDDQELRNFRMSGAETHMGRINASSIYA